MQNKDCIVSDVLHILVMTLLAAINQPVIVITNHARNKAIKMLIYQYTSQVLP